MKLKKLIMTGCLIAIIATLSCTSSNNASTAIGGEVIGVSSGATREPIPYGMVLVKRGSLKVGQEGTDSLWGATTPSKDISVESFWMDEKEVSNAKYRQFVFWVRDSIIRTRLADPAYGGDESYMITEDKYGEPVTPHLNWAKPIPWKKPNEDEARAIESLYYTHPFTGEKMLDVKQLNYRYEIFDYTQAALRKNQLDPNDRTRNTDQAVTNDVVMISKDTAYIDDEGRIVRETKNRELTGLYDFVNTYIVNIFPDTTCWINDFPNANNETYMRLYFSHPSYNDYPVVGVSWEQANAFCAWRTSYLLSGLGPQAQYVQRYRLPTEAEWEFAARGRENNIYPWKAADSKDENGCFYANFKPERGNYTEDGSLITTKVGSYKPNSNGLYDMAGNVAEWTSTVYTEAGILQMNDMNPELYYNAAMEDPYYMKKKAIRGGSWKDAEKFIESSWRTYEYQNEQRSYIGFRCVRTQVGSATGTGRRK